MGVGNVLFNEDPAYSHIYLMMYKALQQRDDSITFEKLLNDRDELIKEGHILPLKVLTEQTLTEEENARLRGEFKSILEDNWLKYNPLIPEVKGVLEKLNERYHLGAIANGPAFLRAIMQEVDVKKYFQVLITSEEFGTPKPNRGIFQEAISQAKDYCDSKDELFGNVLIMVGDSLEHDISPANQMGMITIQLAWDMDKKYNKSDLLDNETFRQYLEHLKKHSSKRRPPSSLEEKPAYVVSSMSELEELVDSESFLGKL